MPQELVHISARSMAVKIVLMILLLVAAIGSYYAVRWYIGNTLADYFNPAQADLTVPQMAAGFAPNDPLTHWRIAQVSQKILPLDQQAKAIAEYERAVSLSPNDYRFWMSLGTAHEQSGDSAKGEQALRRAVALAPSYAYPHWYLGNLLLRSGRYEEAFKELRRAAEADAELQPQQFNFLWAIYSENLEALKTALGESSETRARFALYLLNQQRHDDGLRVWNSLADEEKKTNREIGNSMVTNLIAARRFHDAMAVWNDIAANERYRAEVGKVFDGSFEDAINYGPEMVFGWQVKTAPQLQIGIDPTKSNRGARSLRLVFQVRAKLENMNISQLVPVAPNSEYDFEYFFTTEKLETGSAPMIQVFDGTDGGALATSAQAPSGSNPWTRVSLSFKTTSKTEAVLIKIMRVNCSEEETETETVICPIFGSIWYDDFSLKRRR
ncbi:MAG TPA: tetratricopeptide repeat protein [Pyrinomonadaceae bacterium]|nr:tetratricopeptide repeat protein [Pyrinomonadaceae bacterium]